jgi:hypothetical protein
VEAPNGRVTWGAGIHNDILAASLKAIVNAANRLDNVDSLDTQTASGVLK